jgi:putative addiction module component (TIGR02574 family)
MTSASSVNHLFTEAQQLPTAARAALAEKIVESIEADISPELEEAHLREIHRRQQEVRNGLVEMLPGESVLAAMRGKLS